MAASFFFKHPGRAVYTQLLLLRPLFSGWLAVCPNFSVVYSEVLPAPSFSCCCFHRSPSLPLPLPRSPTALLVHGKQILTLPLLLRPPEIV